MCDTCGCVTTSDHTHDTASAHGHGSGEAAEKRVEQVELVEKLLARNDHTAGHNRQHLEKHAVLGINLMSSPGSGKTALLESTVGALGSVDAMAVIEGDLETENDAERIRKQGVKALQIMTGTSCHLDAHQIHQALHRLDLSALDHLFIENVGNLVCPASYDLGQHLNVVLLSVTEGDDKPAKYPVIFRTADLILITKTDLLPVLTDFDVERCEEYVRRLGVTAPMLRVSARSGEGMAAWIAQLKSAWQDRFGADSPQVRAAVG
ncbi:MAG: hydrogenase nickel incorporation protein HypB [Magnetococcales bacterium]|nr:hydrogenase nickel incorporation protein HypB [Magnetococcales bacterium]